MKNFVVAILSGVIAGLIAVWTMRLIFGEDIVGLVPAIAGAVAGFVLVSKSNKQKKTNG